MRVCVCARARVCVCVCVCVLLLHRKLRVGVSVAICFAIISVLVFLLFERTSLVELNRAEAEYEFDDNSTILSSVSFDVSATHIVVH